MKTPKSVLLIPPLASASLLGVFLFAGQQPAPVDVPSAAGPFENTGQLWLAIIFAAGNAFNAWWTSYQRLRSEERQGRAAEAAAKLQAEKEERDLLARERQIEREREWVLQDREAAMRQAELAARRIEQKIDENTEATTATLNVASVLNRKVAEVGALRKHDLAEVEGEIELRRNKRDRRAEDRAKSADTHHIHSEGRDDDGHE